MLQIGIQLYSVRNALKEDFKGTLAELAGMGFQGVEFAFDYGGLKPAELKAVLEEHGLRAVGIYERLKNICTPDSEVYCQAEALECKYLTFGFGLAQLEENFSSCLEQCREALEAATSEGKSLCYHAHAHEFRKLNGEYYLDLLLNAEGLERMAFEADTAWIQKGGEDIIPYMEKYAGRIPLLHMKDLSAEGEVTELGNGVIDLSAVADFASGHNIPWLIYEQDTSRGDSLDSAQTSMAYMKKLLRKGF